MAAVWLAGCGEDVADAAIGEDVAPFEEESEAVLVTNVPGVDFDVDVSVSDADIALLTIELSLI